MRACRLIFVLCAACGREDVELLDAALPEGPIIPGLVGLTVTPGDATLVIEDLGLREEVEFVAEGRFENGSSRDVSAEVAWRLDNAAPGGFVGAGMWRSSNSAGGPVVVAALANGIRATADLTVVLQPVISDPVFPPPPGAQDLFDVGAVVVDDPNRSPHIVYPAHQVMFPVNVYRILFQHEAGTGNDVFQLHFVSQYLDMKVYTTADRWQADAIPWGYLALTNAGRQVEMTISAVDLASPETIWSSTPITLYFSQSAVEGAIYYWSTSSEGVMKGVISQPSPTKFYTQPPDATCVACHTVSRDGRRMAVGYNGEDLQEIRVPDRDVVIPAGTYDMGWSTFSPDGKRLLIAAAGELKLLDADTGAPLGPNGGVVPTGGFLATHPDWSPLGDYVAVSVCSRATDNRSVEGCGIARIRYTSGTWGAVETLVAAGAAPDNNYFPRYSPDGRWLVYVNATGRSKDQPTAELRLIRATGGTSRTLLRANRRVGPDSDVSGIANTMPTWAPSTHQGTQWLAFSSARQYGKVVTDADQLWVVGLDLSFPETVDPSYAAFWLPLQDAGELNHRAFWAVDADDPCAATAEVCDGYDNDCDGIVDDDCTPCGDEICFDGLDNDCDGWVDELCVD